MSRKIGINRVKLQSYVVLPQEINNNSASNQKISLLTESKVQVSNGGKDLCFDFDRCFSTSCTDKEATTADSNLVPSELVSILSNTIDLVLLGYSSTILCYCSQTPKKHSGSYIDSDPLFQLVSELSSNLYQRLNENSSPANGSISNFEYKIELSCFDLIDSQFRDLINGSSNDIRLKESDEALCVHGIQSYVCKDRDSLLDTIKSAFTKRMLMVLGSNDSLINVSNRKLTAQELNSLQPTMIGYLGNTIIQITLHSYQTILLPASSSNQLMSHKIHRKALLNLVWLNTADNLITMMENTTFKAFVDYQSFLNGSIDWLTPSSGPSNLANNSSSRGEAVAATDYQSRQLQLKNSLKSLSTLTRVVTSLMERNISSNSTVSDPSNKSSGINAINANEGKKVHIPFRDSVLTRLLKNVLNGNCFLSMITIPPTGNIEGASRSLRFASQIGKLFNLIWINEELLLKQLLQQQVQLLQPSRRKVDDEVESKPIEDRINNQDQISETFLHFTNLENEMNQQMSLLAKELENLEFLRSNTLQHLSLQLQPVKTYGESKSAMTFIQESFQELTKQQQQEQEKSEKSITTTNDEETLPALDKNDPIQTTSTGLKSLEDISSEIINMETMDLIKETGVVADPSKSLIVSKSSKLIGNKSTSMKKESFSSPNVDSNISQKRKPSQLPLLPTLKNSPQIEKESSPSTTLFALQTKERSVAISRSADTNDIANNSNSSSTKEITSLSKNLRAVSQSDKLSRKPELTSSYREMKESMQKMDSSLPRKGPTNTQNSMTIIPQKRVQTASTSISSSSVQRGATSKPRHNIRLESLKASSGSGKNGSPPIPSKAAISIETTSKDEDNEETEFDLSALKEGIPMDSLITEMRNEFYQDGNIPNNDLQESKSGKSMNNLRSPGPLSRQQKEKTGSRLPPVSPPLKSLSRSSSKSLLQNPSTPPNHSSSNGRGQSNISLTTSPQKSPHHSRRSSASMSTGQSPSQSKPVTPLRSPGLTPRDSLPPLLTADEAKPSPSQEIEVHSSSSKRSSDGNDTVDLLQQSREIDPIADRDEEDRGDGNDNNSDDDNIFSSEKGQDHKDDQEGFEGVSELHSDAAPIQKKVSLRSVYYGIPDELLPRKQPPNSLDDEPDEDERREKKEGKEGEDEDEEDAENDEQEAKEEGDNEDEHEDAEEDQQSKKKKPKLLKETKDTLPPILRTTKKMAEKEEEMLTAIFKDPTLSTSSQRKKKRRQEEDENNLDDEDDGLTEMERQFLRSVSTGNMTKTTYYLQHGVNIHVKNSFERDAMQIAARNGSIPLLQLLHSHGGSLYTRGLRGDTLFHLAGYNGHIDTMRWLQKRGILPEAVDLMGQTVIHVAARRGELAVLKYLYEELNMDGFSQEDFDGRTPLDCIPRRGPPEIEQCRDYLTMIYTLESSSSTDG